MLSSLRLRYLLGNVFVSVAPFGKMLWSCAFQGLFWSNLAAVWGLATMRRAVTKKNARHDGRREYDKLGLWRNDASPPLIDSQ
ncbi:hypothetical protein Plhal304r1_c002g0005631 [Plasmopara halstedii]